VVWTLPLANFWLFLGLFLVLFTAAGAGNGATYRMIPIIFARRGATGQSGEVKESVGTARKSAAALGLVSAVGAYGGFVIPQVLNASNKATGSYDGAFYGFVGGYLLMLAVTWFFYLRPSSKLGKV
jgi:NNP family nitrate/nitrite transporter-like MFS transporter